MKNVHGDPSGYVLKTLGNDFIDSGMELSNTSIKEVMRFNNGTKWFTRTDPT